VLQIPALVAQAQRDDFDLSQIQNFPVTGCVTVGQAPSSPRSMVKIACPQVQAAQR